MSEPIPETGNEEIVIRYPADSPVNHLHDWRTVICKRGVKTITLGPRLKEPGDPRVGHDKEHTYVRTADVDSSGRAIFRPEGV